MYVTRVCISGSWLLASVIVLLQAAMSWCYVFFVFRRLPLLQFLAERLRVCWPLCSTAGSLRGLPGLNHAMVLRGVACALCCGYLAAACAFLLRPMARIALQIRLVFRWAPLLRTQLAQRFLVLPPSLCWCLVVFSFERPYYSVLLALPPLYFLSCNGLTYDLCWRSLWCFCWAPLLRTLLSRPVSFSSHS